MVRTDRCGRWNLRPDSDRGSRRAPRRPVHRGWLPKPARDTQRDHRRAVATRDARPLVGSRRNGRSTPEIAIEPRLRARGRSGFADSFANRAMEMLERIFVSPVHHFSDRAGFEAVLDSLAQREILVDDAEQQIHRARPFQRRCGRQDADGRDALSDMRTGRKDPVDLGVVGLHHENRVGKQVHQDGRVRNQVPLLLRKVAQLLDRFAHADIPRVAAERVEHREVLHEQRAHVLRVQHLDVVRLPEGVADQLPVHAARDHARLLMRKPSDAVRFDVFAEPRQHRVDVYRVAGRIARRRSHEDEPVLLGDRQRNQAASRAIESFESVIVGNRDQAPVKVVAPRMIGARKSFRLGAASTYQLRPAMPADIDEGPQLTSSVAHDEQRHRRKIFDQVVAGIGNLRAEPGDDRMIAKEHIALPRRPLRRRVRGCVVARESRAHRRRAAIDRLKDLMDYLNLRRVLHATEHISEWPVAESTRTSTVSPAPIPAAPAKIAVLNCGVLPASIPPPRRAGPSTRTGNSSPTIARLRASDDSSWIAISSISLRPFSSSLTESPSRKARVCSRTEYLNMNAASYPTSRMMAVVAAKSDSSSP